MAQTEGVLGRAVKLLVEKQRKRKEKEREEKNERKEESEQANKQASKQASKRSKKGTRDKHQSVILVTRVTNLVTKLVT